MAYLKSKMQCFLGGIGSLISIFPMTDTRPATTSLYKPARDVEEAFRGDWERLGKDMKKAVRTVIGNGKK